MSSTRRHGAAWVLALVLHGTLFLLGRGARIPSFAIAQPPTSQREASSPIEMWVERRPGGRAAVFGGPPGWSSTIGIDAMVLPARGAASPPSTARAQGASAPRRGSYVQRDAGSRPRGLVAALAVDTRSSGPDGVSPCEGDCGSPSGPPTGDQDGYSDVGDSVDPLAILSGVRLAAATEAAPSAPTRSPASKSTVTPRRVQEAVRSDVRRADRELGLANPEQPILMDAVALSGRDTGLPSGTRFKVSFRVSADGAVSGIELVSMSAGDAVAWAAFRERLVAGLPAKIPLDVDGRSAGVTVVVDAVILHVFPSGGDTAIRSGSCPKMPVVGDEPPPHFVAIGGAPYLQEANGECILEDTADVGLKTIVVRTSATTILPGADLPASVDTFAKPSKKKKRWPSFLDLLPKPTPGPKHEDEAP
ncbi:MAG: hypothetical protein U0271_04110 [Polyangiaceae bacterium]